MTQTNELKTEPTEKPANDSIEKVKVIGLGKAGVKIVNNLKQISEAAWFDVAAVDTDASSIKSSELDNNFLIGEEWTNGLGCGGDVLKGERALAHKSNIQIKDFLNNTSLLILVCGFGGGTATGGSPVVSRMAKDRNIPTVFLITIPFAFEGHSKREIAEEQIKTLMKTTNTVIPIPNDLLYTSLPASTPFAEAFEKANHEVARAVLGIAELLRCNNLISVDLCDLHNLLCRQKSECGIGIGIADKSDSTNKTHNAIKKMLDSPLLGGRQRIKSADALIMTITGGNDLTIGEVKFTLDAIERITNRKTEIVVGANTDPLYEDKIQITILPVNFDETASPEQKEPALTLEINPAQTNIIKNINKLKDEAVQLELPFENQSRGMFTNSTPTFYNGEDLDIPTFQRKGIHLDKGK